MNRHKTRLVDRVHLDKVKVSVASKDSLNNSNRGRVEHHSAIYSMNLRKCLVVKEAQDHGNIMFRPKAKMLC